MKYWLLTTEFPPFFGGGIATYCYHTVRMLARYGHEVTVFVPDENIERHISAEENGNVRIVRFKPGYEPYYQFLGWIAALSYQFSEIVDRFIEQDGLPDIIEAQDYLGIAYFTLQKKYTFCGKTQDVPIIITAHTPKFIVDLYNRENVYRFPDFWIGEMERFCIKAASALISPSLFLIQELQKHLDFRDVTTEIIRNPFEIESPLTPFEGDERRIIFFGRLQYRKGILHIIELFQELWEDGMSFRIELVGGDHYMRTLGQWTSEYLIKKYHKYFERGLLKWIGPVRPEFLPSLFSQTYVGIIPPVFENFPYTAVELMAHGVLTLASDSGGQAEIIEDGKNGFLFSLTDKDSFRRKFLTVLHLNETDRAKIRESAQSTIQKVCSYEVVYNQKIGLIERIVWSAKPRRVFPFVRVGSKGCSSDNAEENGPDEGNNGLLSVVIPYYNMGSTIKETVESVFRSSYPKKEVIIINDGSDSPDSIAVLYQIAREYPVRIVHKRNEGLAQARNDGARHARGEFVAFLDADDLVEPDYYELAIKILKTYSNISFVGCWTRYFDGAHGIWPTWNPEPPYLLVHNTINSSGLVFRRKDFMRFGLNDPQMIYGLEDHECVIRMVGKGCGGVAIPQPLFKYRVRSESMYRQLNRERMIYLYRLLVEKNRELYRQYAVEVINLLNANGPGYLYDNPTWELPPVGFVVGITAPQQSQDWAQAISPPVEVKQALLALWSNPLFRRMVKAFFLLGLHKLFIRGTDHKDTPA